MRAVPSGALQRPAQREGPLGQHSVRRSRDLRPREGRRVHKVLRRQAQPGRPFRPRRPRIHDSEGRKNLSIPRSRLNQNFKWFAGRRDEEVVIGR